MDSPRLLLVVLLLFFLFLSPDSHAPSLQQQRELDYAVLDERRSLDILNGSSYGGFDVPNNRWLNITGLRQGDGYIWDVLPKVQTRAKEQLQMIFETTNGIGNVSMDRSSDGRSDAQEPLVGNRGMYQNVTSILHGKWARSALEENIVPPILNLSSLAPKVYYTSTKYNRNITGPTGDLRIQLHEQDHGDPLPDPDTARNIKAQMTIKDELSSGDGWELTMLGVHYPRQGGIVLSTTSEKFAGIFALPHFALSGEAFVLAQRLLNQTLMSTIKEQETRSRSVANPWTSSPHNPSEEVFPTPHCEFIVYLQQHPIEGTDIDVAALETELRFPTGAAIPPVPLIRMSSMIFSPDCAFVLESQGPPDFTPSQGLHLSGRKQESFMRDARRCIFAFATMVCAQILLLIRQMKDASTPSTKSRISFYTIAMMALGDGLACMGFMVISMFVDAAFLPSITTTFLSFLGVSFFGMKFLMDIWAVQSPERQERARERQRERDRRNAPTIPTRSPTSAPATALVPVPSPAPISATIVTAAGADTLPLPVTARRPIDNPIIITPDQDLDAAEAEDNAMAQNTPQTTLGNARREMSALYSKFYFLLLGILLLSLYATTWPTILRSAYSNALALLYISFWIPQIRRNVSRNCRKALRWEFVIGESVLRLAPILYFYTIPDNVLFVVNDTNAAYLLIGWMWLQVWALVSQEILGPRFFVPNGWAPPAYDYHPIIREDDEEAGATMPTGFTQATADPASPNVVKPGESREKGKKAWDCAICTENIEVSVMPPADSAAADSAASMSATTIFSRRAYMVTPCRHIFHSYCLEGWMRYRLQCPICRENLPPL